MRLDTLVFVEISIKILLIEKPLSGYHIASTLDIELGAGQQIDYLAT